MSEHSAENGAPVCEFGDCRRDGWTVLHFGPKLTPPLRVACRTHQSQTDLRNFRCLDCDGYGIDDDLTPCPSCVIPPGKGGAA